MMSNTVFGQLFQGRTVVITGSGRGIGKAALQAFHQTGATLLTHVGRNRADLDQLPPNAKGITADFTKSTGQQEFIDFVKSEAESIDVLINNAGTMLGRFPADSITEEQYQHIVELNQHAVVRVTRGLLPLMYASENASIVNTVSISASTGGSPGSSVYSATKAFVSTYSRGLARELAPKGIRVNAVSPGVIDTDFHGRYSSPEKLENTRKQIPLQRLGTADDCAPTFLFLAAPELSGYITGQVIEINGGQR